MVTLELIKNREQVLIRDNHTCQICGAKNCRIEVHHINSIGSNFKYSNNPQDDTLPNLMTLCIHCHRRLNFKAWLRDPIFLERFNLKILSNFMDIL